MHALPQRPRISATRAFHNLGLPVAEHRDTGREQGLRRLAASSVQRRRALRGRPGRRRPFAFPAAAGKPARRLQDPSPRNVARTAPGISTTGVSPRLRKRCGFTWSRRKAKTLGEREGTLDLIPDLTGYRQGGGSGRLPENPGQRALPEAVTTPPEQR